MINIRTTRVAFVLLLAIGLTVVYAWHRKDEEKIALNAETTVRLTEQQRIFAEWFALYQKDIDDLNRNWQIYHHTIDSFKIGQTDLPSCHERLSRLVDSEQELTERIENRNLPPKLDDFLYDKAKILRDKMREYAAAQYKTIALTRAAANPDKVQSDDANEQSRAMEQIMIRESPTALFIADEVYAVRQYLSPVERTESDATE